MSDNKWQGRRVLVTGHTGFKGGWLTLKLAAAGARVCGYSLAPTTTPNLFEAARIAEVCRSEIGDIRDGARFASVVNDFEPEVVFHLAAQPLVRLSYHDPVETYSTNVMGLITVFEALRRCPSVRTIINVTSDKCYENREWIWGYRETDALGGYDPYSSSKGCAEIVTASWRRSFFETAGVRLASGRAGNVIGGADWAQDRLLPDFIRAVSAGEKLVIRSPKATRPWQHVLEPLAGYTMLAERLMDGDDLAEGWNFGPDRESVQNVEWIAGTVCRLWGRGASFGIAENADFHEAHNLMLDNSKARGQLGWKPRWQIDQTLERTVQWYRAFADGEDARNLCCRDIEDYERVSQTSALEIEA